jgi:hypothetical protein
MKENTKALLVLAGLVSAFSGNFVQSSNTYSNNPLNPPAIVQEYNELNNQFDSLSISYRELTTINKEEMSGHLDSARGIENKLTEMENSDLYLKAAGTYEEDLASYKNTLQNKRNLGLGMMIVGVLSVIGLGKGILYNKRPTSIEKKN